MTMISYLFRTEAWEMFKEECLVIDSRLGDKVIHRFFAA